MKKECPFEKQFYETMDFSCDLKQTDLCHSKSCFCGCEQIATMVTNARETYFDHRDYYSMTVFETVDNIPLGKLSAFDVLKAKNRILLKLRRLNIPGFKAIGGFDVQLQDYIDLDQSRKSRWLPHWHFLFIADVSELDLKAMIYRKFNAGMSQRIAKLTLITEKPYRCSYLYKQPYDFKKKLKSTEKGQRKRQYRIKGKAKRELLDYLKENNRPDWIALIGFRRYGNNIITI